MTNLIEIQYAQTGKSSNTDDLGMREMQAMVYAQRNRQYLLVKAPPASGKSRAMMFVALDKLATRSYFLKRFSRAWRVRKDLYSFISVIRCGTEQNITE